MNQWGRAARSATLLATVGLGIAAACGSSRGLSPAAKVTGKACQDDTACYGGKCITVETAAGDGDSYCTVPCTSDLDCGGAADFACGVGPDGSRVCMHDCHHVGSGATCIDGLPTACAVAPDSECRDCDCPTGLHCKLDVGCMQRVGVGEPCAEDGECNTDNCSNFAGVCRVPVGQACDDTNCDLCFSSGGWSYCSRRCGPGGGYCNDDSSTCVGPKDTGPYFCKPKCSGPSDPLCPEACDFYVHDTGTSFETIWYCDCVGCESTSPARELGNDCTSDSVCASGQCSFIDCAECTGVGWCTTSCTANADCPANMVCADFPCVAGSTECGPQCMLPCDSGRCMSAHCSTMTDADGDSVDVCDPRFPEGTACTSDVKCQSGSCIAGACAASATLPNGESCVTGDDCDSGNCVTGTCRGTALLGDTCTDGFDCSVGVCCSGVCDTAC